MVLTHFTDNSIAIGFKNNKYNKFKEMLPPIQGKYSDTMLKVIDKNK